MHSNNYNLNA